MSKKENKFEVIGKAKDVVRHLKDLVDALDKGTLCISKGEESIVLKPKGDMHLEMEAKQKEDKEKLSLKLSWYTAVEEETGEEESLCISAKEPKPKTETPANAAKDEQDSKADTTKKTTNTTKK